MPGACPSPGIFQLTLQRFQRYPAYAAELPRPMPPSINSPTKCSVAALLPRDRCTQTAGVSLISELHHKGTLHKRCVSSEPSLATVLVLNTEIMAANQMQ
jgi:hypothetical protein